MPDQDIVAQVEYNNWANEKILRAAAKLTDEQMMAPEAGWSNSSIFDTLRHLLDVQWSWRELCQGHEATKYLWELEPLESFKQVRARWRRDAADLLAFAQSLSDADLERKIHPFGARTKQVTIGSVLLHIIHHGTGHRAEIGWRLTAHGHSPGQMEYLNYIAKRSSTPND